MTIRRCGGPIGRDTQVSNLLTLAQGAEEIGPSIAAIGYGTAAIGGGVGAGLIWSSVISGTARQPEAQGKLMGIAWISYVLVEVLALIGLVLYFIS